MGRVELFETGRAISARIRNVTKSCPKAWLIAFVDSYSGN
jgi:hypothetical protein